MTACVSPLKAPRVYRFVENKTATVPDSCHPAARQAELDFSHQKIEFADNKTSTDFKQRSCQVKHPKRRKVCQVGTITSAAKLTVRKPVKTFVPIDAWALIFARSHASFLFKARLVCRDFRDILNHQPIWQQSCEQTFGGTTPPCPDDISEFRYANLLVGKGCQIKPCHRRETRKCYWPFLLRACEECLEKITISVAAAEGLEEDSYAEMYDGLARSVRLKLPETLADLLPAYNACQGRWSGPRKLDSQFGWVFDGGEPHILLHDYLELCHEFTSCQHQQEFDFVHWATERWKKTKTRMELVKQLRSISDGPVHAREVLRQEKEMYFIKRANRLEQPMVSNLELEQIVEPILYYLACDILTHDSLSSS